MGKFLPYINKNNELLVGTRYALRNRPKRISDRRGVAANIAKLNEGYPTMRRYLILALAPFVFFLAAPSAFARIVFDPGPVPNEVVTPAPNYICNVGGNAPCDIGVAGQTYQVAYLPCALVLPSALVGNVQAAYPGFAAVSCLWLNQVTNSPMLNTFTFDLTPVAGLGSPVDCVGYPTQMSLRHACPSQTVNGVYTATFYAPVFQGDNFYIFTDFATTGFAGVTASLTVPEPGELGLFGLGLLGIGVGYGWKKRRESRRTNYAS